MAKFTCEVRGNGDQFGSTVRMDGDVIVVGATGVDANDNVSGAAYVFKKPSDGWKDMTETAKIYASDGDYYDGFGGNIAINETTILVGAPSHDSNFSNEGAVYIFERPEGGWVDASEDAQLVPNEITSYDFFGASIDIHNDVLVVGATASSVQDKAIYVFEKQMNGWNEIARLTASDVISSSGFGGGVAIYDDVIVAGAGGDDDNGEYSGSAYLYYRPIDGWEDMTESVKIVPSNGYKEEHFGNKVKLSKNFLAISAPERRGEYLNAGAVYVYERPKDGWGTIEPEETFILTASDAYAHEQFGAGLAIDGINIAVGIPFKHIEGYDEGAVYIFEGCDGGKCDGNNLTINTTNNGSFLPDDEYWAMSTLTSDITLSNVSEINYKAGSTIVLKEGFHAPNGASFSATIEQCQIQEDNLIEQNLQLSSRANQLSEEITMGLKITPNPFQYSTTIKYTLEKASTVNLRIYDMSGQLVKELVAQEKQSEGIHEYTFESKVDAGNFYFAVLTTPESVITKKLILIR